MAARGTSAVPRLVRGSVITHRRRCGKPSCRCADGRELHGSTVLSYSEGGHTRFLMLPAGQVAAVRAAVERYRDRKESLEQQADDGLVALARALAAAKGRR